MSSNIIVTIAASSSGFLSGFVEESVEKPSDGLNGDCIVHYGGERSKYKMRVQLVQGKREWQRLQMMECHI